MRSNTLLERAVDAAVGRTLAIWHKSSKKKASKHNSSTTYASTCVSGIYPPTCTYIHTYILTCLHTYILTYLHTYILTYLHTYTLTYLHTYIPNRRYTSPPALRWIIGVKAIISLHTTKTFVGARARTPDPHPGDLLCASQICTVAHNSRNVPEHFPDGHLAVL